MYYINIFNNTLAMHGFLFVQNKIPYKFLHDYFWDNLCI